MQPSRRRFGISIKLMFATFALLAGVLATLTWSTYQNGARMLAEGQHASMSNLVQHTGSTLEVLQERMGSLLLSIAANTELWEMSDARVESTLETYRLYQPLVGGIYLVHDDDHIVGVPKPYVRALGNLFAPAVVEQLAAGSGLIWTKPYLSQMSHWTVTVATRVFLPNGQSPGYVAMDVPILAMIYDGLPSLSFEDRSTLLVATRENEIVVADFENPLLGYRLSTNQLHGPSGVVNEILAARSGEFTQVSVGGEAYSLLVGDTTNNGWRPILLFNSAALQNGRLQVARTSLALLALVGAVSLALAGLVARTFARPLEVLTREMARVQEGRLEGIDLPRRNDEIGDLVRAFNGMMERIRKLLEDLRQTEQAKKETEIRWLQAQIKPHFLYNTLNAIGHSAALGRTEDVYMMIQSLTRVLSYTFRQASDGKDSVAHSPTEESILAEELAFLEDYIRLQQIRYGRSFHTTYAVEAGLGRCKLLRLSLQPIVENAILHGLSQVGEGGVLQIAARSADGRLILQIGDNGPGIPTERLANIRQPNGVARQHLGVYNTMERLALHYGDMSVLKVESPNPAASNGMGTRVTIELPLNYGTGATANDVAHGAKNASLMSDARPPSLLAANLALKEQPS